jgi:hypothetical protein
MNLIRGPNDARWATYGFARSGPRRHKAAKPVGDSHTIGRPGEICLVPYLELPPNFELADGLPFARAWIFGSTAGDAADSALLPCRFHVPCPAQSPNNLELDDVVGSATVPCPSSKGRTKLAQSYCFIRRFLLSPAAQAGLFLSLRWPSLARCWSPPEVP